MIKLDDLAGYEFALIENETGEAESGTTMRFGRRHKHAIEASYEGPNVSHGHALVTQTAAGSTTMVYHALDADGALNAGTAKVIIEHVPMTMRLEWQWLTGDRSRGTSLWRRREKSAPA